MYSTYGNLIKQIMIQQGISDKTLAQKLNIQLKDLDHLLSINNYIDVNILEEIANILNINIGDLIYQGLLISKQNNKLEFSWMNELMEPLSELHKILYPNSLKRLN